MFNHYYTADKYQSLDYSRQVGEMRAVDWVWFKVSRQLRQQAGPPADQSAG